ncbi:p-aminobenzoyl-glutamate transporter [Actinoplanes lobatus]|uniref:Aminobenzoyl-glutamate transport protein n=1 Tax=Actinoplanes lobatus TaxID=113568 RepID=A0A7W7HL36_9ACTN|nr:AbgT family transporter [Actinoplanes lobatus]MBB4752499.1 aminobenzoyl-glutamate transport protein [Actinoplanes lobatus]GGN99059.1 p-aminobenzoyl-glutamate transporter [Actinoplanes lobatus]GIE46280.1 p-aminobenzoyl-glutamate transporter [Actinoplanes lobatus]
MTAEAVPAKRTFSQKMLDGVEKIGNKVPHPVMIFLILIGLIIVLSAIFAAMQVQVTYEVTEPPPVAAEESYPGGTYEPSLDVAPEQLYDTDVETHTETTKIESLLTADGIRFIFTSAVTNFTNFGVVGVILVAMVGVGLAEQAGLIGALIRKLVAVSPKWSLTFIIVLLGILSSVASDAGYLVLIPLGAVAFLSVGRHPLAGLAAAFAAVGATFGVNVIITPIDGIVTEVTNESAHLVDPTRTIGLTANLYFGIASTIFLAFLITFITEKFIEPRLGRYEPIGNGGPHDATQLPTPDDTAEPEIDQAAESRGLRFALGGFLAVLGILLLLTVPPSGILRNPETGSLVEDSPLMDGLIFIIMLIFLVCGVCYGAGAGSLKGSAAAMEAITKTFAGLGGLIFMLLVIAQFIAYFNYTNMATIAAVKMADGLESANIGPLWLLVGFIVVTLILDIIIPGVIPKWAIFAPVFVPLFLRLGVAPQTVLAAYRVGDSPMNVVTPLMVYLPFIVLLAQRYKKAAGVGTVVSLMIPYTLIISLAWILFFVAWYLLGIPLGPGAPVELP